MSNSKPLIGYWELRGLCQPIRLLAAYLEMDLNEKRYSLKDFDAWVQKDKLSLGLDFPNVPYLIHGDFKLTESRAILKYVAREFGQARGVYPTKTKDVAVCDMVENVLWDAWFALLRYANMDLEPLKNSFETDTPKKIQYLNDFLQNKKFVLGDQITYVDFILYEMLYHYTAYKADYLQKYANLVQFKKRFEEIPAISKYIASDKYIKAPCINPFAKIKF